MAQVEGTIHIARRPEEIWSYMTQIEHIPEWAAYTHAVESISPGPLEIGSTFTTLQKLEDVEVRAPHRVAEFVLRTRLKLLVQRWTSGITTWLYEAVGTGTNITVTVDHETKEQEERVVQKELSFLKQILETGQAPGRKPWEEARESDRRLTSRVGGSIFVDRPVTEIWQYMVQVERIPEWAAGARGVVDITPGPHGVGSKFKTVFDLKLGEVRPPHVTTQFVPNQKWELNIVFPYTSDITWNLIPKDTGTDVAVTVEYHFGEREQQALEKELQFLKQVLETGLIPDSSLKGKS